TAHTVSAMISASVNARPIRAVRCNSYGSGREDAAGAPASLSPPRPFTPRAWRAHASISSRSIGGRSRGEWAPECPVRERSGGALSYALTPCGSRSSIASKPSNSVKLPTGFPFRRSGPASESLSSKYRRRISSRHHFCFYCCVRCRVLHQQREKVRPARSAHILIRAFNGAGHHLSWGSIEAETGTGWVLRRV